MPEELIICSSDCHHCTHKVGRREVNLPLQQKKSPKHEANNFEVNKIIFVAIPRDQQRDTVQSQVLNLHEFLLLQTQVEFRPSQAVVNVVHDR